MGMNPSNARKIRWGRVIAAAVMAEIAVILMIGAVILGHRFLFAPNETAAETGAFGQVAGYYVAPAGAAIMTFLFVLWAARKLKSDFVLHGLLIGVAGVVLTAAFVFGAKPEDR